MSGLSSLVAASVACAFVLAPVPARADITKKQCIEANTKSQDLRRDGKLSEAREQLRKCGDSACPRIVRDDCTRRLDDLEKAQPSLIFDVKDAKGADVIEVRVGMDGQPLVDHLDGTALNVDPGAHTFTFEVAGQPPVVEKVLVREGESGRHEHVVFATLGGSPEPPPDSHPLPATSAPETAVSKGMSTQRLIGLVVGGVGVAGLAAGAVFGILGSSAWDSAKQACGGNASSCTDVPSGQSYQSTASTDATISTVAFIAGGALLAGGGVLFFTGPRESRPANALVITPSVGPRVAGLALSGAFQ